MALIYVFYFPVKILLLVKSGNLKDKAFRERYGGVYEAYKEDALKTAAFEVVVLIKKLLIAVSLVFLGDHSFIQLLSIIIYTLGYYYLLSFWKPYKLAKANTYFRKSELMFACGLTFMLVCAWK